MPSLPATVAANAGTVTVTAKHKGLAGNDIDLRLNYLGQAGGETTPAGLAVAFTPMTGGTLNPVLTAALGNIGADQNFDFIINPYTDSTSIAAVGSFLNETTGRWSWQQQLFGGAWPGAQCRNRPWPLSPKLLCAGAAGARSRTTNPKPPRPKPAHPGNRLEWARRNRRYVKMPGFLPDARYRVTCIAGRSAP